MPGQCLSRESGKSTPSSMASPGKEGPCCTKSVPVLSMLQQCLYNTEALKDPSKSWMSRGGMLEHLSLMFLVVIAALHSVMLGSPRVNCLQQGSSRP